MTNFTDEVQQLPDFQQSSPGIINDDLIMVQNLQIYYRTRCQDNTMTWGHERCVIICVLEGKCQVKSGDITLHLNAGKVCIIPPLTPHSFPGTEDNRRLLLSFNPIGDIWKLKALNGQILTLRRNESRELQKIVRLFNAWASEDIHAGQECELRMNLLLNSLINQHLPLLTGMPNGSAAKHSRDIISGALKYLAVNRDHRVTAAELSRVLNVSASSLRSTFKNVMKRSLGDYERNQRIRLAIRLLRSGTMDIGTIAATTGFESPSSLSRAFQNEPTIRKTPFQIRKDAKPGQK